MSEFKIKVMTLYIDDTIFVQYVDRNEVDTLLQEVKKVQPGMAHFINNKCIYNGVISKEKCNRWEIILKQEIN